MQIELRNDSVVIKGYINAVERDSRVLQSPQNAFVEQVRSGTWERALSNNDDIVILLNHNWEKKLGSTKDNLILREDNIGLFAEARVYDSEVIHKAEEKALVGWSFGFHANKQSWGKTDNDIDRRYLDDIDLYEVSLLDNTRTPAYYGTSIIEIRDNQEVFIEHRFIDEDIETIDDRTLEDNLIKDNQKDVEKRIKLMELELELA